MYRSERGFRHSVATSGATPLVAAGWLVAVRMYAYGVSDVEAWIGTGVLLATAYVMMYIVNRFTLIRVRSRLSTSVFLFLTAMCTFLPPLDTAMYTGGLLLLSYLALFLSYQSPRAEGCVFHAFAMLAVAAVFHPLVLIMVPVYYISLIVHFRSFSTRAFLAGLIGLSVPMWFMLAYHIWQGRLDEWWESITSIGLPALPDYSALTVGEAATCAFVLLLGLTALVHMLRTAYNDKVQTRMTFYFLCVQEAVLMLALALQPHDAHVWLRLLIINSAPLVGHYFALGRGLVVGAWFYIVLALIAAGTAFNLWIPSYSSLSITAI